MYTSEDTDFRCEGCGGYFSSPIHYTRGFGFYCSECLEEHTNIRKNIYPIDNCNE